MTAHDLPFDEGDDEGPTLSFPHGRRNSDRKVSLPVLLAAVSLAGVLGSCWSSSLTYIGRQEQSPAVRLASLEAEERRQDSTHMAKINGLSEQLGILSDMTSSLVSMKCLDRDSMLALRAQVPCARVLREQGIRR